ncbi:MAG: ATP synthase F1 subunit delta [Holosporaceae bacterium]|nr:ATP synthase F1 subunit delta [Holosporaceae bacterium]
MVEDDFALGDAVVRRYVKSLHEVAVSAGVEAEVLAQMKKLKEFVGAIGSYGGVLKRASLMFDFGMKFISRLKTELNLSKEVSAFLDLLRKNKRLPLLVNMCDCYVAMADGVNRRKIVRVAYGKSFSVAAEKKLKTNLEKIFGAPVECRLRKDPSLLDGVKIQHRSKVLDYSLKSKLNRLRNAIGGGM